MLISRRRASHTSPVRVCWLKSFVMWPSSFPFHTHSRLVCTECVYTEWHPSYVHGTIFHLFSSCAFESLSRVSVFCPLPLRILGQNDHTIYMSCALNFLSSHATRTSRKRFRTPPPPSRRIRPPPSPRWRRRRVSCRSGHWWPFWVCWAALSHRLSHMAKLHTPTSQRSSCSHSCTNHTTCNRV